MCQDSFLGNMKMESKNDNESATGTLRNSCTRCGTCCEKGGPSFHLEDRSLIDSGIIHTRYLFTIRKGEMVHDNVRDRMMPSDSEIIKIKGEKGSWTCTFFNRQEKSCEIYKYRPLECRVLKCWNPSELEKMYDRNRLTRKELLADIAGLWELVEDHEQQCGYDKLKLSMDDLDGSFRNTAIKAVITIVHYDREIRRMVTSQGSVEPDMTDFLFGRPLDETIEMFGYKVGNRDGKY